MAWPKLIICDKLDRVSVSNCTMDEALKVANEGVRIDLPRAQPLSARKGEKLRDQAHAPIRGFRRGHRQCPDLIILGRMVFDKLQISGDYQQQIVKVVGNAPRQLADRLHLLALMQLFLDQATSLESVLM